MKLLSAVAWPYANGPRHIGHVAGFGVPSDVFSRYMRMAGNDVLMGGAGAIAASANVATDRHAAMIDAGLAGELADGRRQAEALLPLTLALFAEPSPAVIKAVLHAQGKIPTPHVRMPLADASPPTAGAGPSRA